ncbi:hypothetical protein PR202_ga24176 [Eleusine coracana subsp. coracana]|uniref:GDSL esterase/lipase n=1 Tax=Eleusine coracana subsp. coracana TaxID=191504 RepID=A0AAV5D8K4_ELECO|nr:hypothetical protein PR202_ga24176 [Eleusine coracana subsp. coracana]
MIPCQRQPAYDMLTGILIDHVFGDSYTDTGNIAIIWSAPASDLLITKPPYGMTFFGHPTGRISDGRLAIDFIAEALGLPFLPPSQAANQSFLQGANFAVAGGTALDRTFFLKNGDQFFVSYNVSLSDQLGWFDAMKPRLCNSTQGGNEFRPDQSKSSVVVCVQKLIKEGGTVVVSGMPPFGCTPANLVFLANQTGGGVEPETGCLKDLNLISKDHNAQLRRALMQLSGRYSGVRVIYADLYTPTINFALTPKRYGFNGTDGALRSCCGTGGGRYNFNASAACGTPGVRACANPSAYVNWDGVHLTEAANHYIADGWLKGPYAHPPILSTV